MIGPDVAPLGTVKANPTDPNRGITLTATPLRVADRTGVISGNHVCTKMKSPGAPDVAEIPENHDGSAATVNPQRWCCHWMW